MRVAVIVEAHRDIGCGCDLPFCGHGESIELVASADVIELANGELELVDIRLDARGWHMDILHRWSEERVLDALFDEGARRLNAIEANWVERMAA